MSYWVTGSIPPFDDSLAIPTKTVVFEDPHTDTSGFNQFRQGVELRTVGQLYGSNQPKLWAGTVDFYGRVKHEQDISTFGQAVSFVEFYNSITQEDLPRFNAVDYMVLGADYPLPLWLNNGPQQEQEAIIEPLPLPYRLPSIEGATPVRGVRGSLDSTNLQILPGASTLMFGQPFLDQGRDLIGESIEGSIVVPGYASSEYSNSEPFDDIRTREVILSALTSIDDTFKAVLLSMTGSLQGDLNPLRGRSSCAGRDCYGPNMARYGTDSIAFANWQRGS